MLPPERRIRSSVEFTAIVRRGARAGRPLLSVHLLAPDGDQQVSAAGLVVGKAVGGAVVRHRTSRRLRHLLGARLDGLPPGLKVVVRANVGAGTATSAELAVELDAALRAGLAKLARSAQASGNRAATVGQQ